MSDAALTAANARYPYRPLSAPSDLQRREFHEALLEASHVRGFIWKVAGGDPEGGAAPAEAAAHQERLSIGQAKGIDPTTGKPYPPGRFRSRMPQHLRQAA